MNILIIYLVGYVITSSSVAILLFKHNQKRYSAIAKDDVIHDSIFGIAMGVMFGILYPIWLLPAVLFMIFNKINKN